MSNTERQQTANAVAKVATDRIPRCKHEDVRFVGASSVKICGSCRRYMPGTKQREVKAK